MLRQRGHIVAVGGFKAAAFVGRRLRVLLARCRFDRGRAFLADGGGGGAFFHLVAHGVGELHHVGEFDQRHGVAVIGDLGGVGRVDGFAEILQHDLAAVIESDDQSTTLLGDLGLVGGRETERVSLARLENDLADLPGSRLRDRFRGALQAREHLRGAQSLPVGHHHLRALAGQLAEIADRDRAAVGEGEGQRSVSTLQAVGDLGAGEPQVQLRLVGHGDRDFLGRLGFIDREHRAGHSSLLKEYGLPGLGMAPKIVKTSSAG